MQVNFANSDSLLPLQLETKPQSFYINVTHVFVFGYEITLTKRTM